MLSAFTLSCTSCSDWLEPSEPAAIVVPSRPPSPELARASEFILARGACYGTCPIDLMLLRADGSVFYWGEDYVDQLGFHTGWLPRGPLGGLAEFVLAEDRYVALERYYPASRTDQATVVTSAVLDGRRKVVEDRGGEAPEPAQNFVMALSALHALTTWDPDPIEAGADAQNAPSCVEFRERVVDACFRYAAGDINSELCTLYSGPAEDTLGGRVPPEFCAELVRSYDLAPPSAGSGPIKFGPTCSSYIASRAFGCRDTLLGRPVVEYGPSCRGLRRILDNLVPDILTAEDEETRQQSITMSESICQFLAER